MTESTAWKKLWQWPWLPICVLVLTNLLIGVLIFKDYGMSTDEPKIYLYSANSINNYQRVANGLPPVDFNNGYLDYYGPAFIMAAGLLARAASYLHLALARSDIWHFSYFLVFQLAVVSLYSLARRWMSLWAAFGAALLFSTQPVLWGHAFINPKDVPFMAAFLVSLAIGFSMVERIATLTAFPETVWPGSIRLRDLNQSVFRPFVSQALKGFRDPAVLFAAVALGLTTSIRVLGPYAGVIVVLYMFYKCPKRTLGLLVPYGVVALFVSFLTWPFLWADPLHHLLGSVLSMSQFPWLGGVLFEGKIVAATELPTRYLPEMISLQLTEPAILLSVAGFAVAVWRMFRGKTLEPGVLLAAWFIFPLLVVILGGSTVYDGFRQVLFLIPPVFISAGLALDWVFQKLKPTLLRVLILILLIAPGIYWIISLHPYEYIYYNSLTGGVSGAFRNFELDYWGTAYREAANYVNRYAPSDAQVVVYGPVETFKPFARSDLRILTPDRMRTLSDQGKLVLDYAVSFSRQNREIKACAGAQIVKTIEREGAILAVVKQIPAGQTGCQ